MRIMMVDRRVLTKVVCERHRQAAKKKGRILDEFVKSTGLDRLLTSPSSSIR